MKNKKVGETAYERTQPHCPNPRCQHKLSMEEVRAGKCKLCRTVIVT